MPDLISLKICFLDMLTKQRRHVLSLEVPEYFTSPRGIRYLDLYHSLTFWTSIHYICTTWSQQHIMEDSQDSINHVVQRAIIDNRQVQKEHDQTRSDMDSLIRELSEAEQDPGQDRRDLVTIQRELEQATSDATQRGFALREAQRIQQNQPQDNRAENNQALDDQAMNGQAQVNPTQNIPVQRIPQHPDQPQPNEAQLNVPEHDPDQEYWPADEEVLEGLVQLYKELNALTFVMRQIHNEIELQGHAYEQHTRVMTETKEILQGMGGRTALMSEANDILRAMRKNTAEMLKIMKADGALVRLRLPERIWISFRVVWLLTTMEEMAIKIKNFIWKSWLLFLVALVIIFTLFVWRDMWLPSPWLPRPVLSSSTASDEWQQFLHHTQAAGTVPEPDPTWQHEQAVPKTSESTHFIPSTTMVGSIITFLSGVAAIPATKEVAAIVWRLKVGLRMDGGFCGYPRISADLVDVDWTVGGLDAGLVDVDLDMDG
jgi:hypothetical protein